MCTVGFGLIAVCSFYGIWEVEEVYYQNRQGFNDTLIEEFRGKNSWDCVVCKIKINDYCSYLYHVNQNSMHVILKLYQNLMYYCYLGNWPWICLHCFHTSIRIVIFSCRQQQGKWTKKMVHPVVIKNSSRCSIICCLFCLCKSF